MTRAEILEALTAPDAAKLYAEADRVRREHVGDAVHLRGLIELSNRCSRQCTYCALRAGNTGVTRYRMAPDEILACARLSQKLGFGTVVLQSGEDHTLSADWVANVVRRIKAETNQAVTLSLGERPEADYALWREAGADRYLLRFETGNLELFQRIHPGSPLPPDGAHPRIRCLETLHRLSYEIGSGIMVGIPGQSYAMLADDLLLFKTLALDMIGLGPYIPSPGTPLADAPELPEGEQVPNTAEAACRALAITRLLLPSANIPSTTALSSVDPAEGRRKGLTRGANIFMPNLTPARYRENYAIYPGKICIKAPEEDDLNTLLETFRQLGRHPGTGPGGRHDAR